MNTSEFKPTTAFRKIAELKKNTRIICGGTSSSKTWSILQYLIYCALKRKLLITVVAESIPVIKRGAYKDFQDILHKLGLYDDSKHNRTDRTYQLNDSVFEFVGVDGDSSKFRGARRDILFVNEANNISWETYQELNIRTRLFTFLDFNPVAPFWAHSELQGQENSDFITLTYKDNEFLEQKIVDEIESWKIKGETSEYWANRWKVMGLGQLGKQSGAIITDWSEIDELPANAELLGSGLDFGYSNDPTSLVGIYRYNGEIIWDEVIYQKGLLNNQIAQLIRQNRTNEAIIYADSAEPKSIAELRSYGFSILPVVKGKDSVNFGLSLIQQTPFRITSRSKNLIKELQNYTWAKDKDGNSLSVPIDAWNHGIDAARYYYLMGSKPQKMSLKWRR